MTKSNYDKMLSETARAISGMQLDESMESRSITQRVIDMTGDQDAEYLDRFNMTHIYNGGQGSEGDILYYVYDDRRDELDTVGIIVDSYTDIDDVTTQVREQDKNRSMNRKVIDVIMADLRQNHLR